MQHIAHFNGADANSACKDLEESFTSAHGVAELQEVIGYGLHNFINTHFKLEKSFTFAHRVAVVQEVVLCGVLHIFAHQIVCLFLILRSLAIANVLYRY